MYYAKYDEEFNGREEVSIKFHNTIDLIGNIFNGTLGQTQFRTAPNFYGLFMTIYHLNYGIKGVDYPKVQVNENNIAKLKNAIDDLNGILESEDPKPEYYAFIRSTKDATTDIPARTIRCKFMINYISNSINP